MPYVLPIDHSTGLQLPSEATPAGAGLSEHGAGAPQSSVAKFLGEWLCVGGNTSTHRLEDIKPPRSCYSQGPYAEGDPSTA